MTLDVIGVGDAVHEIINITLDDFIEEGSSLREARSFSADGARDALMEGRRPTAVIVDVETLAAEAFFRRIVEMYPSVPVILPIHTPRNFHIAAVLRSQVWARLFNALLLRSFPANDRRLRGRHGSGPGGVTRSC